MLSSRCSGIMRLHWNGIAFASVQLENCRAYATTDVPSSLTGAQVPPTEISPFKRGAGGRSSFSGNVVTVFGATGGIGQSVINHLARQGNQIIIPYRCDPYWVKELKVVGDLGQILFFPFTLDDEESIRKAVKYSNIVVNLIGTQNHTSHWPMHKTHVEGAGRIAKIAKQSGVERLIHISALGADPNYQPKFYKKAQFLKTKGLGELAVRDEFPQATIIRPTVVYGDRDYFIRYLLTYARKPPGLNLVYTYKAGKQTFKMPLFSYDASLGISRAATDPTAVGKTYEFVGPHNYRMDNLLHYMFAKARCIRLFGNEITLHGFRYEPSFWLISQYFKLSSKIFRAPTRINYEWIEFIEANSDVLTGEPLIGDLGVHRLAEFENAGGYWCYLYSFTRNLDERYGEIEKEPPLPIRSPPLRKEKAPIRMEEIAVERKPFHHVAAEV